MHTKGPHPQQSCQPLPADPLLRAAMEATQLKQLYRQGWLARGLPPERCETVAEHSFATALLALLVCETGAMPVDRLRVLELALVHDLGEIHAGDITPAQGVSRAEKHNRERQGIATYLADFPQAERLRELWEEYEAGETAEAQLVRQLDRLEMAIQAAVYQRTDALPAEEFFASAERAVTMPELKQRLGELLGRAT